MCGDLRDIIDSGLKEKSIPNLISKNVKSITVKRKESLNGINLFDAFLRDQLKLIGLNHGMR